MDLSLKFKVDNKIVLKAVHELNDVIQKYAALNVIRCPEGSTTKGQDEVLKTGEKTNAELNQLLDLVASTYRNISLNRRSFVKLKDESTSRSEVSPDQNTEMHCICCPSKSDRHRTSAEAGVSSTLSTDTKINSEKIKEAIAEFSGIVRKFQCFRSKYSKINQLLQNVENTLSIAQELFVDTASKETLTFHCKCCIENCKKVLRSSEKDGVQESFKKVKVSDEKSEKKDEEMDVPAKDDEPSPQDQVFATDLAFELILQSVPTPNLLTCRLVNNLWNSNCTKVLLKKQTVKTDIIFRENLNSDLEEIMEILTIVKNTGRQFPSSDFRFFGGPLNHPLFQELITTFGSDLKSFSIDFDVPEMGNLVTNEDMTFIKKLLTVQLPNIEKFIIHNVVTNPQYRHLLYFPPDQHWETGEISIMPEGPLPNTNTHLKYFDVGAGVDSRLLEIILQVAINLQEVEWDSSKIEDDLINNSIGLLPSIIKFNKLHLIKSTGIIFYLSFASDFYHHLVRHKLPLRTIALNFVECLTRVSQQLPELGTYISQILEQSEDTLTDLSLAPLAFLPNFRIPILTKLKTLNIVGPETHTGEFDQYIIPGIDDNPLYGKYFPDELPLSQMFLNLKRLNVKVEFEYNDDHPWERRFNVAQPKTDVHESVEELYFSEYPPLSWLENFTRVFPNLTTLTIMNHHNEIEKVMKIILKFQQLQNLVLGYRVHFTAFKFPALDALFTGFAHAFCCELFEEQRNILNDNELKQFRVNHSILDFKNLKYLKLILYDDKMDEIERSELLMTHVSGAFAFALCPNLRVELEMKTSEANEIKLWTGMDTLFPYVHSASFVN